MGQTIGESLFAQGQREGLSLSLLKTLNFRFPDQVSPEVIAKLHHQDDPEVLSLWLDLAFQAESWDQFRDASGL